MLIVKNEEEKAIIVVATLARHILLDHIFSVLHLLFGGIEFKLVVNL